MKKYLMIAAAAALAACAGTGGTDSLKGRRFAATKDDVRITLNFDAKVMRANGKVMNSYNSPYEINGDNIIFETLASTMMMPLGKAADVERDYFKFIGSGALGYKYSGGTLTLSDSGGNEMKFKEVR